MQYCDGETLQDFLEKTNAPDARNCEKLKWKIFRQVLEAVHYLHSREIIHRDIKPDNIFLDHNKDARLGDFGLAKRIHPHNKKDNQNMVGGGASGEVNPYDLLQIPDNNKLTGK